MTVKDMCGDKIEASIRNHLEHRIASCLWLIKMWTLFHHQEVNSDVYVPFFLPVPTEGALGVMREGSRRVSWHSGEGSISMTEVAIPAAV